MAQFDAMVFEDLNNSTILLTRKVIKNPALSDNNLFLRFDTTKMKTFEGMYAEFQTTLKLPDYFGRNFDALDECICDLEWLPADGYILYFANCEHILEFEKKGDFEVLVKLLSDAGNEWIEPDSAKPEWDRIKKNFVSILHFDEAHYEQRKKILDQSKLKYREIG